MDSQELLAEIESALSRMGMSASQFGQLAVKDRSFVADLREGRDVRMSTARRVRDFIAKQESGDDDSGERGDSA